MGTRMACFCGCHDNKKELVLDGNKPSGNHGNCRENVKRQTLNAWAREISVIELQAIWLSMFFHWLWFYFILYLLLLNQTFQILTAEEQKVNKGAA